MFKLTITFACCMLKQYTVPDKKRVGSTCGTTRFRYVISCSRDFFRSVPALGIVVVRFGSCNTHTHIYIYIYTHVDLEAIQSQKKMRATARSGYVVSRTCDYLLNFVALLWVLRSCFGFVRHVFHRFVFRILANIFRRNRGIRIPNSSGGANFHPATCET